MNAPIVRPRVADLIYQLYDRPLHPELFDILAARRVDRGDYQLTVRITRTGHVVTWETRDSQLTEVAGAIDQPLPERRRIIHQRIRGEHNSSFDNERGIRYQTSFQVEILPDEIFQHVHDEILRDGEKRGLLFHFRPNHRLSLSPLGMITVESRADCLFLSSFHTFPEDLAVVKSQSLIERRK